MSGSKHFDKIAWGVVALMLVLTVLFMNGAALGIEVMGRTMGYENRLFDNTRVHTIDIVMDDWDEFIASATDEEYYAASVVVDGEAYKNVGVRGKGNTSLSTVSSLGSERYSFKIEFDQYDASMTYHGLDKLSLNNLIQDSTMMKDYLTYTMMNEFGAAAPLCSFVYITVNGEDWGLYLAVEGVEDSFLERNYGSDHGELYKPDSLSFGGGRGNGKDFDMGDFNFDFGTSETEPPATDANGGSFDWSSMMGGDFDPSSIPGGSFDPSSREEGNKENGGFNIGNMGGFGMGSSDVKLQYIDDNVDSYSNIWNNAKTDITEADQTRLIESLRKLTSGEDIGSVVDIEQVIRYFVVHNFVCNGDSYTGSMIHNYYLYEENGQLAMLPWDYNLAYGTFQGGNGNSTVNTPIDAPVSGGAGEDRPMWSWILSDGSYTELYHQYFAEFLTSVDIIGIINDAYELIKPYVAKDPTAFYTYEEFEVGVQTLRQFCELRAQSVSMQLENGETARSMNYVDASALTLSNMGSMGGGMGGFGNMQERPNGSSTGGMPTSPDDSSMGGFPNGTGNNGSQSDWQNGSTSGTPGGMDNSQMPGDFDPSKMPEDFDPSQLPSDMGSGFPGQAPTGNGSGSQGGKENGTANRPSGGNMQMPGGDIDFGNGSAGNFAPQGNGLGWIIASILILGVALVIVKIYRV